MLDNKLGSYAVDGIYESFDRGMHYRHDVNKQPPLLVLSLEENAIVQKVKVMLRFEAHTAGTFL